jgi:hypothetical protein
MAKTFIQWCEDKKYDLNFLVERGLRTGMHYPMPTGYIKHAYPHKYYNASLATTDVDWKNFDQYKDKAPSNEAP